PVIRGSRPPVTTPLDFHEIKIGEPVPLKDGREMIGVRSARLRNGVVAFGVAVYGERDTEPYGIDVEMNRRHALGKPGDRRERDLRRAAALAPQRESLTARALE